MERWRLANRNRRLRVLTFPHYHPRWADRHSYYHRDPLLTHSDVDAVHVIPVLITCFNEDRSALHQSLTDLFTQQQELQVIHRSTGLWLLHVVVVLDGWFKSSASMRDYLFDLLRNGAPGPATNNTDEWRSLWKTLSEWADDTDETTKVETMIIQVVDSVPAMKKKKAHRSEVPHNDDGRRKHSEDIAAIPFDVSEDKNNKRDMVNEPALKISFLIKRDNRRKHNSHEWCLLAFAPIYAGTYLRRDKAGPIIDAEAARVATTKTNIGSGTVSKAMGMTMRLRSRTASHATLQKWNGRIANGLVGPMRRFKLVFLTDCGTRFHAACLGALVDQMLVDDRCVACSGRQRVMSATMQDTPIPSSAAVWDTCTGYDLWKSIICFRETVYRAAQCFDYEASISAFTGAFSLVGMVPVIPGPCGLFRLDYIVRSDRDVGTMRVLDERFTLWIHLLKGMHTPLDNARNKFVKIAEVLQDILQHDAAQLCDTIQNDERLMFVMECDEQKEALASAIKHGQAAFHMAIFAISELRAIVVKCAQSVNSGALIHVTEIMEEALWMAENTLMQVHSRIVIPEGSESEDEDEDEPFQGYAPQPISEDIDEHEVVIAMPDVRREESDEKERGYPQPVSTRKYNGNSSAGAVNASSEMEDLDSANELMSLLRSIDGLLKSLKQRTSGILSHAKLPRTPVTEPASKSNSTFAIAPSQNSRLSSGNKQGLAGGQWLAVGSDLGLSLDRDRDREVIEEKKPSSRDHNGSASSTPAMLYRRNDSPTVTASADSATSTHTALSMQDKPVSQPGSALPPELTHWANEGRRCIDMLKRMNTLTDSCASQLSGLTMLLQELVSAWKTAKDGGEQSVQRSIEVDGDGVDKMQPVDVARDACDLYFKCVNKKPEESGLILGCLLLAEDRVLSYAAVMKPPPEHQSVHTAFVPNALFYFEAETDAVKLFNQRRRWINGTIAGYIWLLTYARGLWGQSLCSVRGLSAILQLLMVGVQLIMYACVALAPVLWMIGLSYSSDALPNVLYDVFGPALPYLPWGYLVLYVLFVIRHTESRRRVDGWDALVIHVFTLFNALIVFFIFACLVSGWQSQFSATYNIYPLFSAWGTGDLVVWGGIRIVIVSMFLPLILAILYDVYWSLPNSPEKNLSARGQSICVPTRTPSCILMIICAPLFYLFLPTLVGTLAVFSMSRTWDLTWGNRPSSALHSLSATLSPAEQAKKKAELFVHARLVSYSVLLINVILTVVAIEANVPAAVAEIVTIFVLVWAALQSIVSLIFISFLLATRLTCLEYIWRLVWATQANRMGGPAKGLAHMRVDSFSEHRENHGVAPRPTAQTTHTAATRADAVDNGDAKHANPPHRQVAGRQEAVLPSRRTSLEQLQHIHAEHQHSQDSEILHQVAHMAPTPPAAVPPAALTRRQSESLAHGSVAVAGVLRNDAAMLEMEQNQRLISVGHAPAQAAATPTLSNMRFEPVPPMYCNAITDESQPTEFTANSLAHLRQHDSSHANIEQSVHIAELRLDRENESGIGKSADQQGEQARNDPHRDSESSAL